MANSQSNEHLPVPPPHVVERATNVLHIPHVSQINESLALFITTPFYASPLHPGIN